MATSLENPATLAAEGTSAAAFSLIAMIDGSYANNVVDFLNFCELRGAAVSEECLEAWMKVMKAAGVEEAINHSTTTAALRMLTRLLGKRNGESVG